MACTQDPNLAGSDDQYLLELISMSDKSLKYLIFSVAKGYPMSVAYLMTLKLDINKDIRGITPLHIACYTGHRLIHSNPAESWG